MNYSVVLMLLLATVNAAKTAEEAGAPNGAVRRRDLGNGKRKKHKNAEKDLESVEEALEIDIENIIEDVAEAEADIEEAEAMAGVKGGEGADGDVKSAPEPRGRKRGGEKGFRQRDGNRTRKGGRGHHMSMKGKDRGHGKLKKQDGDHKRNKPTHKGADGNKKVRGDGKEKTDRNKTNREKLEKPEKTDRNKMNKEKPERNKEKTNRGGMPKQRTGGDAGGKARKLNEARM